MRLIILGSASGYPTANKTCSGYILDLDGQLILLDCGSGVTRAFMQARLDPFMLNSIIISHTHPDHIGDLPLFIQMLKLGRKSGIVDIYLPEEAIEATRNFLDACYLYRENLPFDLNMRPVNKSWTIAPDDVTIYSIANRHLIEHATIIEQGGYANKAQSYSYKIIFGGKKIFYSGDIKSLNDINSHLDDLDLLLIETTHIDLTEMLELIAVRNIKKIVLTHIHDDKESELKRVIQNNKYGLDLIAAGDGDIITL